MNNKAHNLLNLPETISINNGSIDHQYTFGGEKIKKSGAEGDRYYIGGIEYNENGLEFISILKGRVLKVDQYQYNLADHLGNEVVMFEDANGDGVIQIEEETNGSPDLEPEVLQRNHYYSFGMRVESPGLINNGEAKNKYLYNGKEIADDYGLNWHYYGFRNYDAAIGRFPSIDPIADNFAFVSGYNYAENEPVAHIDLWGLQKRLPDGPGGTPHFELNEVKVVGGKKEGASTNPDDYWKFTKDGNTEYRTTSQVFSYAHQRGGLLEYKLLKEGYGLDYARAYMRYTVQRTQSEFYQNFETVLTLTTPWMLIGGGVTRGSAIITARQLANSTKITVATMAKSSRNAYFGHTVIGIGDDFFHQVMNGSMLNGEGKLLEYGSKLGKEYSTVTFLIPSKNAQAGLSYAIGILGKRQTYSIIPGFGQNCTSNGVDIIRSMGVSVPSAVKTPGQLSLYMKLLKATGRIK